MLIRFNVDDELVAVEVVVSLRNEAMRVQDEGMPGTAKVLRQIACQIALQIGERREFSIEKDGMVNIVTNATLAEWEAEGWTLKETR